MRVLQVEGDSAWGEGCESGKEKPCTPPTAGAELPRAPGAVL